MITMTFTCAYCGKVFTRTNYPSALRISRRKYCTQKHAALAVGGMNRPPVECWMWWGRKMHWVEIPKSFAKNFNEV